MVHTVHASPAVGVTFNLDLRAADFRCCRKPQLAFNFACLHNCLLSLNVTWAAASVYY